MPRIALATALCLALFAAPAGAATTVAVEGGGVKARGDDGPNRIVVSPVDEGRGYAFEDPDGVSAGEGCRQETPTRATCPRVENPTVCEGDSCSHTIEAVYVDALGGDDDVRVGYGPAAEGWPQSHALVDAGPGNDFVGGTPVVDYTLDGGPGDDVIDGAGYNDDLDGGGGRDVLFGGPGSDDLADGDGPARPDADVLEGGPCVDARCAPAGPVEPGDTDDSVDYEGRRAPVFVDLRAAEAVQGQRGEGDVVRNVEAAYGGRGADHLIAGPGPSRLLGDAGADTLEARGGGDDFLNCGDGVDVATTDPSDRPYDCESLCEQVEGCPRPAVEVRGVPRGCARRSFTARIRARRVPGFRRIVVSARDEGKLAESRRRRLRVRVPLDRQRGYYQLDVAAIGRAQGRRVVTVVSFELNTCRPVP